MSLQQTNKTFIALANTLFLQNFSVGLEENKAVDYQFYLLTATLQQNSAELHAANNIVKFVRKNSFETSDQFVDFVHNWRFFELVKKIARNNSEPAYSWIYSPPLCLSMASDLVINMITGSKGLEVYSQQIELVKDIIKVSETFLAKYAYAYLTNMN